jgi:NAD(P)-dependent dehydrogenase (short-subunit alcohol dehydrogenase family)
MRSVLITGANGGLGTCLVKKYCSEGYQVFAFDYKLDENSTKMETGLGNLELFSFIDVRDPNSIEKALKLVAAKTDKIDILINAAAILPDNSVNVLEMFNIEGALDVYSTNALGPLRMVQKFLHMVRNSEGKTIVNISSEAGSLSTHNNYINRYDYCMSKAALNMQSVILQRYLHPENIRVIAIHPGWMKTVMGGEEAPILPEISADGIFDLVCSCRNDFECGIYFDYDGCQRSW